MTPTILAYADNNSARPGEIIEFMVSAEGVSEYQVEFVRLTCCDTGQEFPPYREHRIETPADGIYPARKQSIAAGSCVLIDDPNHKTTPLSFTATVYVWPTRLRKARQALMGTWDEETGSGYGLELDSNGCLSFRAGQPGRQCDVTLSKPLVERRWQLVGVHFDGKHNTVRLFSRPQADRQFPVLSVEQELFEIDVQPDASAASFRMAAWPLARESRRIITTCHFDGKLDRPRLSSLMTDEQLCAFEEARLDASTCPVIAAWDFALDIDSQRVSDVSANRLNGHTLNLPTRAVTGANWTGEEFDWRHAREQYGAIHFHCDDLYSAEWDADFALTVPATMTSGLYAARLFAKDIEYYVPFSVRPGLRAQQSKLLFLVPSATYLAYANIKVRIVSPYTDALTGRLTVVDPLDLVMLERPELGLSTYDAHADGSPVHYSSRLRPVVNHRPKDSDLTMAYNNFACDLLLIDWLEHLGIEYDVMTDEDLHAEGLAALDGYQCVMTGTHPEYYSLAMLDALDGFVRHGGHLMYMGGNGFYWRVAFHPDMPGVMEHRRAQQNIERWNPGVGQYFHSFTGEHGGLWWDVGRAPQFLSGVGFIAQGFDEGSVYRIKETASDPRVKFMFEGVRGEEIGEHGLLPGGNAGIELDRYSPRRGSPSHAFVVASSGGHTRLYERLDEVPPDGIDAETGDEAVRADMVYFECDGGGSVFSVGSIAYAFGLSHNRYENNASRVAHNVLKRFIT